MRKVLVIFGTRPEAIKMAPLVKVLEQDPRIECQVAVTAQHRGMLDQVLSLFQIEPHYDLNIMKPGQDLFDVTANALLGLRPILQEYEPDIVLVHGDTTTCLVGALAAFYKKIKVGHVEAGLRTGDLQAPFPEEANRTLVGTLTDLHFAPTETAKQNLLNEGVEEDRIWVTGNTVIDALLSVKEKISTFDRGYWEDALGNEVFKQLDQREGKLVLITGHRRENFGEGFLKLCRSIRALAEEHPDCIFVYPVHLNPNVQKPVYEMLDGADNILLTEPLDYLPFVWLLDQSDIVLTDSGGIQEEAPSLGKPVLVTREVTERPEALEAGTVILVGTDETKITSKVSELLTNDEAYRSMARAMNPYGDGKACQRILDALLA